MGNAMVGCNAPQFLGQRSVDHNGKKDISIYST
jgi:hypothetical protein